MGGHPQMYKPWQTPFISLSLYNTNWTCCGSHIPLHHCRDVRPPPKPHPSGPTHILLPSQLCTASMGLNALLASCSRVFIIPAIYHQQLGTVQMSSVLVGIKQGLDKRMSSAWERHMNWVTHQLDSWIHFGLVKQDKVCPYRIALSDKTVFFNRKTPIK